MTSSVLILLGLLGGAAAAVSMTFTSDEYETGNVDCSGDSLGTNTRTTGDCQPFNQMPFQKFEASGEGTANTTCSAKTTINAIGGNDINSCGTPMYSFILDGACHKSNGGGSYKAVCGAPVQMVIEIVLDLDFATADMVKVEATTRLQLKAAGVSTWETIKIEFKAGSIIATITADDEVNARVILQKKDAIAAAVTAGVKVTTVSTTISLKYTLDAKPGQLQPTCEEIGDEGKTSIAVALRAVLKANPADIKWDGWKTGVAAATMATHKDQIKGVEVVCSTECAQPPAKRLLSPSSVEARVTILAPKADAQNVLRLLKEHASMGAAAAVAIDIKYQALNVNYTYASQASGGLQGTVSSWGNSGIKFCRKPGAVNSTCEEIAGFGEQCDISCPSVVAPATCGQTNDVAVGGQTDAGAGGGQTDAGAGGGQTDAGAGGQGFGNVPTAGQNGTTATVPAGGFTNQGCSAVTHCVFPTPATQDNIPPACALGVMQDPPPASAIGDCDTSKWAVGYTPEWKCVKQVASYLASNCMTEAIEAATNLAPATFAITFPGLDLATLTEADKVKMMSDIRDKVAGMLFKHAAVPTNTAQFLKISLAAGSVVATVELPLYVNASATDAAAAELGEVELTVAGKPVKSSPVKATAPKVPSQESVGECPSTVKDKETCLAACKANDQWTGAAEYVTVEFGDIFKRCECGSKHKTYTHCETMDFTVPIVLIIVVLVLLVVVCCCCCKCCGCCCFKKSASAVQPKDTASEATLPALGGGV